MANNIFSLEGKCAVVFGGGGWLGSAVVDSMLDLGAKVVVADMFPEKTKVYVKKLENRENCIFFPCDVTKCESVRAAYDKCEEAFGRMNAMVTLVSFGAAANIEVMTDEQFTRGIDGALTCTFRVIREAIPYLEKNEKSCIVTTSSMYGVVSPDYRIYGVSGQNNPCNYGAAKAGVLQLTRYAAGHLAPKGIRVNSVIPGPFPDEIQKPPKEFLAELSGKTMLGRIGHPSEIAGAFCYFISDAAAFTTGASLAVDGGWTAW